MAAGGVVFDLRRGERNQQQWHADPVVEAALDIEALADPRRKAWLGHDRFSERRIGWGEHDRQHDRLNHVELSEHERGGHGSGDDREGEPNAQQARRNRILVSEKSHLDPGGICEQDDRERRFRQDANADAVRPRRQPVGDHRSYQDTDEDEHHRAGDGSVGQPPRHSSDAKHGGGDDREFPFHDVTLPPPRRTRITLIR